MLAMDHRTELTPRKFTVPKPAPCSAATIGLRPGRYRNDHSSAAITPGMPYGRKNASRKKRLNRTVTESSSSASTVAKISITGIWTTPNRSTRPTPRRNDESEKTWA